MQKVDQLKYDARHLKAAQENLKRKRDERRAHERNREVRIALNSNCFEKNIYISLNVLKNLLPSLITTLVPFTIKQRIFFHISKTKIYQFTALTQMGW